MQDSFGNSVGNTNIIADSRFGYRGIAVGPVVTIDHRLPDLQDRIFEGEQPPGNIQELVDQEIAKLETGLAKVSEFLETLRQKAEDRHDSVSLEHIRAYEQHCDSIVSGAQKIISEDHKTAEKAVFVFARRTVEKFLKIDDLTYRMKADDYQSSARKLIRALLDMDQIDLSRTDIPKNPIIVADDLSPVELLDILHEVDPDGLIVLQGSPSGHVGEVCRAHHIPCVFLAKDEDFETLIAREGQNVVINGIDRTVIPAPGPEQIEHYDGLEKRLKRRNEDLRHFAQLETKTADSETIHLSGTIAEATDADELQRFGISRISLVRTEMLFGDFDAIPPLEEQIEVYGEILHHAKGRDGNPDMTVTFRTFDFEGDKAKKYQYKPEEKQDMLHTQMKAILIAAGKNNMPVRVKIPNVRLASELQALKSLYESVYEELQNTGEPVPTERPPFGMMVETPSAAYHIDRFIELSDFYSVGLNDLPASLVNCERGRWDHEPFLDILHPEIIHPIIDLAKMSKIRELDFTICGSPAMDENTMALFIGMGIRRFSVPPAAALEMRYTASRIDTKEAEALVAEIREMNDVEKIAEKLRAFNRKNHIGALNETVSDTSPVPEPGAK